MKKRILSVLLALSMAVCMLSGCGLKKDDVISNGVEEKVKVTKKLEEKYIERIGAYQEYFKQVKTEYSDYEIGGTITVDSDGLPLMWLILGESTSWDDVRTTQLIGYVNEKVTVLAESGEVIVPYRGKLIMGEGQSADEYSNDKIYLYDEKEKDFITVNDLVNPKNTDEKIYSEKELEEKIDYVSSLISSMNHINDIFVGVNESESKVAYFGTSYPSKTYDDVQALIKLGVFSSFVGNSSTMLYLKKEYADNKVARKYFDKLQDADLSEDELSSILNDYKSEMNGDTIKLIPKKLMPEGIFVLSDGSQCSGEDIWKYIGIIDNLKSNEWNSKGYGVNGFFEDLDFERIMRELEKNPIYTQEELFVYLISITCNYDIVELNLDDYALSKLSDEKIADIIKTYFDSFYNKYNFTDELLDNHFELLETEPYKTIYKNHIDSISFADNIATVICDDNEYQFQIEFTEDGNKISKIEYIDPYANLPEWKKQYIAYVEEKNVEMAGGSFCLVNINNDEIPEIACTALMLCDTLIGFKDNEIQVIGDYSCGCVKVFDEYLFVNDDTGLGLYSYKDNNLETLFYIEYAHYGLYYYPEEDSMLSYKDCLKKMNKIAGVDIDSISDIEFNYDIDSIKQAIIEY